MNLWHKITHTRWGLLAFTPVAVFILMADSCGNNPTNTAEQSSAATEQKQFDTAQPLPNFKYSGLRETLIEIESAQANDSQTTTFFFNQGVTDPVSSCPSLGFPIPSTDQLSNPSQVVTEDNSGASGVVAGVVGQIDPNGVYTGDSTGTYIVCISPNGQTFIQYWEGFVMNVTGPAVWNESTHQVTLTGPSTVTIKPKA